MTPFSAPMFRLFDIWRRSPEGVLTRLEALALRGWLMAAVRSPRFGLSVLVITVFAVVGVVRAASLMAAMPKVGLVAAAGAGFAVFRSAFIAPGSPRWRALRAGVLHPWIAFGPALGRWVWLRAGFMTFAACLGVALIFLLTRPGQVLLCLPGMMAGAIVAAATVRIPMPRLRFAPIRLRTNLPLALRVSLTGTLRRKAGFVPVWLLSGGLWALASPASALASHNNPGTHVGFGMITVVGLVCGLALAWPNLRLIRFLAFQPIPLRRIVAPLCGPQVGLVALLAVAAAFGAGEPFGMAMISATVVTAGVCVWLVLLIPYAMTRSVAAAPGMAAGELFVAVIVKFSFQFGIIAAGWLVFRSIANLRAVRRNRWKEPL